MVELVASRRADLLGGAAWMAFGVAILVGAWRMDRFESMGATLYTAPGLVPAAYGLILLALGAALAWRNRRPDANAASAPLLNRRIVLMALLTLTYALLGVGRLPFGPVTAVFVAAFCWTFDGRPAGLARAATAVITGVATAVVVVLVFERVFLVRLP